MATMKSLTLWIECPRTTLSHINIKSCFKCDYYTGIVNDKIMCTFEE